ncbi:hypothetical protein IWQ60_006536 [Tieghemiomyces parasiticus]|uniref:Ricin B lectin domain-containing protein n=1 Tax=Tieghemiomyces parasiticus TaxID=78921 RepID=A0A9W8A444_9FUNG|nr:hypothetical protein IWQ60_006536 [Tieghemiomyces parasiticus]
MHILLRHLTVILAVLTTLPVTHSTAMFLQQPNKLIDGTGRCLTVSDGDIYSGAELVVQPCDSRHPAWQIFRSVPYARKYEGAYAVIQVGGKCVQAMAPGNARLMGSTTEMIGSGDEDKAGRGSITMTKPPPSSAHPTADPQVKRVGGAPSPLPTVILADCTFEDDQLFKWSVHLPRRFQLQNKANGQCISSESHAEAVMMPCNRDEAVQMWSLTPIGGSFCDRSVWQEFKSSDWSVRQLMDRVGLDWDQYTHTVSKQGIPSLTMADRNLLLNCDLDIRTFFYDLDRHNTNMFSKLLTYPGIYNTQVILATENTVDMFLAAGLRNKVWSGLSPLADTFVDQFAVMLSAKYPQYTWMIQVGRDVVKQAINKTDNGSPPDLNAWGSRVQAIFDESVSHIQPHTEYESYANLYQTKTIQEIFGSEEDVRSQITVLLTKEISKAPAMAPFCCVTQHALQFGSSDYTDPETGLHYRVIMPGNARSKLQAVPLGKYVNWLDVITGRNGWGLHRVQTISNWGTCTLNI